jgi:hypothetical protein
MRHILARARQFAARLWRATDGGAAAESAIVVPALLLLLSATVDLAQIANQGLLLDAGIRAGAGYAMTCPGNQPDLGISCTTTITGIVTGSNTFSGTVSVSFPDAEGTSASAGYPQFCTCGDGSAITCITDLSNEETVCDSGPKQVYITIQADETGLSPLLQWAGFPTSIMRKLTVRVS